MPARTVLILQHVEVEKPGLILDALSGSGLDVDIRNLIDLPGASAADLPPVADLAGLVVMGGPMNADDLAGHPALKVERELLAAALAAGVPTLGVCLGAQLLARAAGLSVRTGAGAEIGWAPLEGVDRTDPVVGPLADAPAVLHWHGDRIVPGPDTRVLARTATTECQAFRAGPVAWGVQFHPEITPDLLDTWLTDPTFTTEAVTTLGPTAPTHLRTAAAAAAPALQPLAGRGLAHVVRLMRERTAR
ncbi:type 1 glutamine amidotransferase [Streptomyces sp. NPDC051940]|uniref:type 1 glutamine amidotransferase n=1 Tax=Streptomyces sp. NPDC051940 TaxID=3155675 RepID=UPI0034309746